MVGRSVVRAAPALIGIAAIGPVLVILTFQRPTGPASASNPAGLSTNAPLASGLAQFSGEGFTMDYPETWHYYPLNFVAAPRFSVAGYLASQPIDTSAICHATPNSASCDFGAYALDPGQAAIEVSYRGGMFGSESPVDFWDHSN